MTDEFKTISDKIGEGYYSEKRSKFLAFARHITSEQMAKAIIAEYRKKYFDARHCCYAYAVGPEREEYRQNDDGEPSSTAGKPIMGQILSNDLTDILIVVVRYYGGVNLGTSGLIEAYRTAAADAIRNCEIVISQVEEIVKFDFTYPMMNGVMRIVKEMNPRIVSRDFNTTCSITLSIRKSKVDELKSRLNGLAFQ